MWVVIYYLQYFKASQLKHRTFAFLITSFLPSDLILSQKLSTDFKPPEVFILCPSTWLLKIVEMCPLKIKVLNPHLDRGQNSIIEALSKRCQWKLCTPVPEYLSVFSETSFSEIMGHFWTFCPWNIIEWKMAAGIVLDFELLSKFRGMVLGEAWGRV